MRERLKGLTEKDYWVYGITESDFDHSITLVKEMIDARTEQYQKKARKIREENSEEIADEILDDVGYYVYTDNQYLWQFALWRLQGLIEAVIAHQLLKPKKLFGLKSKLEALKDNGYTVEQEEIDELILWANLRNAISHAPPEQYRPTPIMEEDIIEYYKFVKKLYSRWQNEKPNETKV